MNNIKKLFLLSLSASLLQSCAGPATTAATTTAQMAYNRNSLKKTYHDVQTTAQAYQKIYVYNNKFKDTNVTVSAYNNVVLITGEAPTQEKKDEIDALVKSVPDTDEVYNFIEISPPVSPLTQISDSWITAKVKSKLIAANDVDPGKIKVITENGTVYLLGILPHEEADAAVEIARTTDGVQNVVKIFSYLTITKV